MIYCIIVKFVSRFCNYILIFHIFQFYWLVNILGQFKCTQLVFIRNMWIFCYKQIWQSSKVISWDVTRVKKYELQDPSTLGNEMHKVSPSYLNLFCPSQDG